MEPLFFLITESKIRSDLDRHPRCRDTGTGSPVTGVKSQPMQPGTAGPRRCLPAYPPAPALKWTRTRGRRALQPARCGWGCLLADEDDAYSTWLPGHHHRGLRRARERTTSAGSCGPPGSPVPSYPPATYIQSTVRSDHLYSSQTVRKPGAYLEDKN